MIEIRGKRGKKVLVLFNMIICQKALDTLVATRTQASVLSSNKYLFAISAANTYIRPTDSLREFGRKCGAKELKNLTLTNLRKYVATTCQILHLEDSD